jgi:hypothetical protein
VQGEGADASLYAMYHALLEALLVGDETEQDSAEMLATLTTLSILGHDDGSIPTREELGALSKEERRILITRINRSLESTGL